MSILRLVSALDPAHHARRPCRADASTAPWRALSLCLYGLMSCTSFADLDDRTMTAEVGSTPPAPSGAAGASATPLPMNELPGVISAPPSEMPAGDPPLDTPPVTGAGPSSLPDADPPPADTEADAGTPPADTPAPPAPPPTDTVQVPACQGLALTLDGTTYASIPRPVDNDFTLEAWIHTTVSPMGVGAFNGRYFFDSDIVGMGAQNDFAISIVNDHVAAGIGNPDTTVEGATTVTTGDWVHVAVTRRASNGQVQVIINGELDAIALTTNLNPLTARPTLAFGGFPDMRRFIGAIDEVKLWSVVRSVQQIAASMRERPTGTEAGLVGYYPFEDQGTVQTRDGSSRGTPAALTGNPVYEPSSALCPPLPLVPPPSDL